jgi:site-specific recombinase XerD
MLGLPEGASELELPGLVEHFLTDLANANHSPHTLRAYAADLSQFIAFCPDSLAALRVETLRAFFATLAPLSPASRARKQASLASFFAWAYRQALIDANPMARIERVKLDPPLTRGVNAEKIEDILAVIPAAEKRDRLLFRLLAETGLRISEALKVYVEDLDLAPDNEHLIVQGKGGRQRSVLLDDPRLIRQVRTYLRAAGFRHGLLFRAEKNGRGGPLSYQAVQKRWAAYCAKAGVECTLHQLRHSHATELLNGGVSIVTILKRLGHRNLQTTLCYAEQSDAAADSEIRAWRRKHS